jgi:hypothetical protein
MPDEKYVVSLDALTQGRVLDPATLPDAHGLSADSMRGSEHYITAPVFAIENGQPVEQAREKLSYHQVTALLGVGQAPEDDPRAIYNRNTVGAAVPVRQHSQFAPQTNNAQVEALTAEVSELKGLLRVLIDSNNADKRPGPIAADVAPTPAQNLAAPETAGTKDGPRDSVPDAGTVVHEVK